MKENYIQLNKDNLLRLKIKTSDGKETGEELVFDLEDIELPLKYQEFIEQNKKNKQNLRNQILIIEKRQDVKGKKLLSKNEEDKIKAINEFFNKEVDVFNIFLGENGVQKLLNGRKLGWTSLQEIDDIIGNQIQPYLEKNMKDITQLVKEKYARVEDKEEQIEVIE